MSALQDSFRAAMRSQASTVCVVAAVTPGGPRGMTATAVMSLSADPPMLVVAVNRSASLNRDLWDGAALSVQFLAEEQVEIARNFAGAIPPEGRFEAGAWAFDEAGAPMLEGAVAALSGVIEQRIEAATHSLVLVAIRTVRVASDLRPLVYASGQFTTLAAADCRCAA